MLDNKQQRQQKISHQNWFLCGLIALLLTIIYVLSGFQSLDEYIYDWNIRQIQTVPHERVITVYVDEKSMENLPTGVSPHHAYSRALDLITPYAKLIYVEIDTHTQQRSAPLTRLAELQQFYQTAPALEKFPEKVAHLDALIQQLPTVHANALSERALLSQLSTDYNALQLTQGVSNTLTSLIERIDTLYEELDDDKRLAAQIQNAAKVVIPWRISEATETIQQKKLPFKPLYAGKNTVFPPTNTNYKAEFNPYFSDKSRAHAVDTLALHNPRTLPLVTAYHDQFYPSVATVLLTHHFGVDQEAIQLHGSRSINVAGVRIPTNSNTTIYPRFYAEGLQRYALHDVLKANFDTSVFNNSIVLLGMDHPRYSQYYATPVGKLAAIDIHAHYISSLLQHDFLHVPYGATIIQLIVTALIFVYLISIIPRFSLGTGIASSVLLLVLISESYFVLLSQNIHLSLLLPLLLLLFGHIAILIKQGFIVYNDVFLSHPDEVESNRLLGLAFQGQGQLDMAFDTFKLCPPEHNILGLLYNLALDYELKNRHRRASNVYHYIQKYDDKFRDVTQRLIQLRYKQKTKSMTTNSLLAGQWRLDTLGDKPQIGRYQIEKQLSKGAMGVVYLGNDTKLNRYVAIKTLTLSQEFEAEELQEATIRFFREASAAGRLKHKNIISIYDAGEESDLAYIAMEFFKGGDLTPYTKPDTLLPIDTVLKIIVCITKALDYAHQCGVIHRDIKPANIMYNPATELVKITDFGIAHITDSSKTKTGVILGTPSYMSPEQLAGRPVDGRTDIFSLGIMLYQLLTGELPFHAESLATLMFCIANEKHPDITEIRADISPKLKRVIDKALHKNAALRYQTCTDFVYALSECYDVGDAKYAH